MNNILSCGNEIYYLLNKIMDFFILCFENILQ